MKRFLTLCVLAAIVCMPLAGCKSTPKKPNTIWESGEADRDSGIVVLTTAYPGPGKQVNAESATKMAKLRCQAWGYEDVVPFSNPTTKEITTPNGKKGMMVRWEFQCIVGKNAPAKKKR